MKQVIDRHPEIVDYAIEAIRARRAEAGAQFDPRRHRRLAAVVHGTALPQHLCRRARLPFKAGMGERAGHGEGRADHRASGDDLGRAGVTRLASRSLRGHDPDRCREAALCLPLANGVSASRIELDGGGANVRPAGLPARGSPGRFRARPAPPHQGRAPIATSSESGHGSIAMPVKPAAPRIRCTRASEANANGPGSSGPCCGSFGTCL